MADLFHDPETSSADVFHDSQTSSPDGHDVYEADVLPSDDDQPAGSVDIRFDTPSLPADVASPSAAVSSSSHLEHVVTSTLNGLLGPQTDGPAGDASDSVIERVNRVNAQAEAIKALAQEGGLLTPIGLKAQADIARQAKIDEETRGPLVEYHREQLKGKTELGKLQTEIDAQKGRSQKDIDAVNQVSAKEKAAAEAEATRQRLRAESAERELAELRAEHQRQAQRTQLAADQTAAKHLGPAKIAATETVATAQADLTVTRAEVEAIKIRRQTWREEFVGRYGLWIAVSCGLVVVIVILLLILLVG